MLSPKGRDQENKKVIIITSGRGRGGQWGLIITFYFFCSKNPKKPFLDTKVFFEYRVLTNIKFVVANIMRGADNILHGAAVILF